MHKLTLSYPFITRFAETARHPDQAAIVARLPVVGRRVPLRGFWRRQRVHPRRMLDHATQEAGHRLAHARQIAAETARHGGHAAFDGVKSGSGTVARATPGRLRQACTSRWGMVAGAFAAGAVAVYYLDAQNGRRRRALVRDKFAHMRRLFQRDIPERVERRGRFFAGVARGVRHNAGELLPHGHEPVDDDTLVARVRSEVLRDTRYHAGEIHVDSYEGRVTIRGQLDTPDDIRRMVDRTRHVPGVREVRSFLHLPGTPPPNKAEAFNGAIPAHMSR